MFPAYTEHITVLKYSNFYDYSIYFKSSIYLFEASDNQYWSSIELTVSSVNLNPLPGLLCSTCRLRTYCLVPRSNTSKFARRVSSELGIGTEPLLLYHPALFPNDAVSSIQALRIRSNRQTEYHLLYEIVLMNSTGAFLRIRNMSRIRQFPSLDSRTRAAIPIPLSVILNLKGSVSCQ
jgi:hypothetical protein